MLRKISSNYRRKTATDGMEAALGTSALLHIGPPAHRPSCTSAPWHLQEDGLWVLRLESQELSELYKVLDALNRLSLHGHRRNGGYTRHIGTSALMHLGTSALAGDGLWVLRLESQELSELYKVLDALYRLSLHGSFAYSAPRMILSVHRVDCMGTGTGRRRIR